MVGTAMVGLGKVVVAEMVAAAGRAVGKARAVAGKHYPAYSQIKMTVELEAVEFGPSSARRGSRGGRSGIEKR